MSRLVGGGVDPLGIGVALTVVHCLLNMVVSCVPDPLAISWIFLSVCPFV